MAVENQTEKQAISKSPLYGYRKPTYDGFNHWCNCTVPNLVSNGYGRGQAYCTRCNTPWYN